MTPATREATVIALPLPHLERRREGVQHIAAPELRPGAGTSRARHQAVEHHLARPDRLEVGAGRNQEHRLAVLVACIQDVQRGLWT